MKKILFSLLFILPLIINAQSEKRKLRSPIWLTHTKNTNIVGLSLGFYPESLFNNNKTDNSSVNTFGIRLEATPFSFLDFLFFYPDMPYDDQEYKNLFNDKYNVCQKIYGLNISTGSDEEIDVHGLSIFGLTHYSRKNNGMTITGVANVIVKANGVFIAGGGNVMYQSNGLMISALNNEANRFNGVQISGRNIIEEKGTGVQIGVYNEANNFKGIQLGLWNKNHKRSLPILNWNFK